VRLLSASFVELESRGGGCRVRMSNDTVIANGTWHEPVFRVMVTLCGGLRGGIRAYLAQIVGQGRARGQWE